MRSCHDGSRCNAHYKSQPGCLPLPRSLCSLRPRTKTKQALRVVLGRCPLPKSFSRKTKSSTAGACLCVGRTQLWSSYCFHGGGDCVTGRCCWKKNTNLKPCETGVCVQVCRCMCCGADPLRGFAAWQVCLMHTAALTSCSRQEEIGLLVYRMTRACGVSRRRRSERVNNLLTSSVGCRNCIPTQQGGAPLRTSCRGRLTGGGCSTRAAAPQTRLSWEHSMHDLTYPQYHPAREAFSSNSAHPCQATNTLLRSRTHQPKSQARIGSDRPPDHHSTRPPLPDVPPPVSRTRGPIGIANLNTRCRQHLQSENSCSHGI